MQNGTNVVVTWRLREVKRHALPPVPNHRPPESTILTRDGAFVILEAPRAAGCATILTRDGAFTLTFLTTGCD